MMRIRVDVVPWMVDVVPWMIDEVRECGVLVKESQGGVFESGVRMGRLKGCSLGR